MTHGLLPLERSLSKRDAKLFGKKVRVVAKPVLTPRALQNRSATRSAEHLLLAPIAESGCTYIARAPVAHARKLLHEECIIGFVQTLPGQIRPTTPAFAEHSRTPVQSNDLETGVVSHDGPPRALRKEASLG